MLIPNHYPLAIDCSIKKFNQIISKGYIALSLPCQTATTFSSFVSIMSEVRYVLMFMTSGTALCPLLNN